LISRVNANAQLQIALRASEPGNLNDIRVILGNEIAITRLVITIAA
jgi:hypothetical protein